MEDTCFFEDYGRCLGQDKVMKTSLDRIKKASLKRDDEIERKVSEKHGTDVTNIMVPVHKKCISTYTSSFHINRLVEKRKCEEQNASMSDKPKKQSRSSTGSNFFDFRKHCLFCSDIKECILLSEYDSKVPKERRIPAYNVRTVVMNAVKGVDGESLRKGGKKYKEYVLQVCNIRRDGLGEIVRNRVLGALSDLHAADARYHEKCRINFFFHFKSLSEENSGPSNEHDKALNYVIDEMKENRDKCWNSIRLFSMYKEVGGKLQCRKTVFRKIVEYLGTEIVQLTSPGKANIIVFAIEAAEQFQLQDDEMDDISASVVTVADEIKKECVQFKSKRTHYPIDINKEKADGSISSTLAFLLETISSKFVDNLIATLIGNMVSAVVTSHPTDLMIALGVLLNREKSLIDIFYQFGVCCSYDEIKLYRYSSAHTMSKVYNLGLPFNAIDGLVHWSGDNFDSEVYSQNCKKTCHVLAVVVGQSGNKNDIEHPMIKRLSKDDMKSDIPYEEDIVTYYGPKSPPMPENISKRKVPRLSLIVEKFITKQRAEDLDFEFLQRIISDNLVPEYSGFNVRYMRNIGLLPSPATHLRYLPLIDAIPSNPNTIITALLTAIEMTKLTGQKTIPYTFDQQLYKVAVDIIFNEPERFKPIVPILGGMHYLGAFIRAIGNLAGSLGLTALLSSTFSSVESMLEGKKYPQNVRALRILVEIMLKDILCKEDGPQSMTELRAYLDSLRLQSRTAKAWIDLVIYPVFIILMFTRACREGNFALHLLAAVLMIPYFFAAGCHHYARYALLYVEWMHNLPDDLHKAFMKDLSVVHLKAGLFTGIWTDQFIECTWMRHGHGPAGVTGIATDPKQMKVWALSAPAITNLSSCVKNMTDTPKDNFLHKEEAAARMKSDALDRNTLEEMFTMYMNPLDPDEHLEQKLHNIVTGQIAPETVNVDDAVAIGTEHMNKFRSSWPEGFYQTISSKEVVLFNTKQRHILIDGKKVFDPNLVYVRAMGLLLSKRDLNFNDIISHECSPLPASMFDEEGKMRVPCSKSTLRAKLQVEVNARSVFRNPNRVLVIDAAALVWTLKWPVTGKPKVIDLVNEMNKTIGEMLKDSVVYLVFDRYNELSIKSYTRMTRLDKSTKVFKFNLNSPLPAKSVVLKSTKNKIQLYKLFVENLTDPGTTPSTTCTNKLVVTGESATPIEIHRGIASSRDDMTTTHEEADVIVVQQSMNAILNGCEEVKVLSDDTDVFALLVYWYSKNGFDVPMYMESPKKNTKNCIDIKESAANCIDSVDDLLKVHAISGCDTVSSLHGIGKPTALNVTNTGRYPLTSLGSMDASTPDVVVECAKFITACYGHESHDMTKCRLSIWTKRTSDAVAKAPELKTLPPTSDSFFYHVLRAHIQVIIWLSTMDPHPPQLDPLRYGWEVDPSGMFLIPKISTDGTPMAPEYILKLIKCGCKSTSPCKTGRCSCHSSGLGCTVFCSCTNGACYNPHTPKVSTSNEN